MSSHAPKPAPTIPSLKKTFITTQTTLLAQPPTPSAAWLAANDASDQPLPTRAVDEAVAALGQVVQQHCRRVYAPQATRNVAQQICNAYVRHVDAKMETDQVGVARDIDLVSDEAIDTLPQAWPSHRDVDALPMEAKRYKDTVARLTQLRVERKRLRQRVEMLGRLKTVMDPLHPAGVQDNLVTRNGPVEQELERMRILLARVAGRVAQLPDTAAASNAVDLDALARADKIRVDDLLANPDLFPS